MSDVFDRWKKPVTKAFDKVTSKLIPSTDPNDRIYSQLKPADFSFLASRYGVPSVAKYIDQMESKKLVGG